MNKAPKISRKYSSPNYSEREKNIRYIILHYTEIPFTDAIDRLCDEASSVSAHYIIKENGPIYQLVEDKFTAWHAGVSYWQGEESLNQSSIGIEIDNLGLGHFTKKQMSSCADLCLYLMNKYNIASKNVLAHSDIAPDRKIDPGIFFDWQYLASKGIGIIPPANNSKHTHISKASMNIKHAQEILSNLGYKIDITGALDQHTSKVLRAFQSRFCPEVIHQKGIEYYNNLNNEYHLDNMTKQALLKLNLT